MNDEQTLVPPTERGGTLHNEILPQLRAFVVEGNVPDGGRIPERELCEMLGVSRTPLREALKVLASEGLIELLPNRGARVKALSAVEIAELFDLMAGLEALAGRLACEKMTAEQFDRIEELHRSMYLHYLRGDRPGYFSDNQEIHSALFAAADNQPLFETARSLQDRLRRVRYAANLGENGERWKEAVREHELLLDALRRRASGDAAEILFNHLRRTKAAVIAYDSGN
ncbi:GntR family transcriptional regulator [Paracoccus onubensis]|uniref:GntR family transcriptional regulator n=1 Tax=Paracoccus onubensis TaxID=1675788 RepID=UPI001C7281C1|nr:GntR family transcriptional regulator [Paracoccus onubensis]